MSGTESEMPAESATLRPRPTSLLELARRDPLLAAVTLVLTAFALAPLFATPFLPLHDLPSHVGLAANLDNVLLGDGLAAEHYRVEPFPVPYWTSYAILWLGSLVSITFAAKLLVGGALLLLPLGTMRLLLALGRDPRMGLMAFALTWEHSMYWGFVAFRLGLGVALFAIAYASEARDRRGVIRACVASVLLAVTHAQAFGIFGLFTAVLWLLEGDFRARWRPRLYIFAAGVLTLIPWLLTRILGSASGADAAPERLWETHDLGAKAFRLFQYSLDNLKIDAGRAEAGFAFAVLLLMPLLMTAWSGRSDRSDRGIVGVHAMSIALYFALPLTVWWPFDQWNIYPRHASVLLLTGLLVGRPRLDGVRALWLLPGVVAAVLVSVQVTKQFADFSERASPFLEIIDAVEPDSAVLTLTFSNGDPAVKVEPYGQFHAYVTADKGGYDPYLWKTHNLPVSYRRDRQLPAPKWNRTSDFRFTTHGAAYDYILVQGVRRDPIQPDRDPVTLVKQTWLWRLYRVEHSPVEDGPAAAE